jgi:acyl transferase domain-containing protein
MKHNNFVFTYSGQGSQYFTMGKDLYDNNLVFKSNMNQCAYILKDILGVDLNDIIFNQGDRHAVFDELKFATPALCSIQYSLTQVLKEEGVFPKALIGYSLGEFVAAIVSNAISLEQGLLMLVRKSEIIQSNCKKGAMLAILANYDDFINYSFVFYGCSLIAVNSSSNFVISGDLKTIKSVQKYLENYLEVLSVELPVKYAFHTKEMEPLKSELLHLVEKMDIKTPNIPIYSSESTNEIRVPSKEHFWNVIRNKIYFKEVVKKVYDIHKCSFIDMSPTGTLAQFINHSKDEQYPVKAIHLIDAYGQNELSLRKALDFLTSCKSVI